MHARTQVRLHANSLKSAHACRSSAEYLFLTGALWDCYGGPVGARGRRRGLALVEGVYRAPPLSCNYARMAQLVKRLLARKVAGSIPPTSNFEKERSSVLND